MIRFFDIIFSFFGLVLLTPVLLVISVWILLDSRGGIFFLQSRVGKDDGDFLLMKFRSMRMNSEIRGGLTIGERDNRITRAGLFLRKFKLDELPQLINVLKGDMSFVGPRPELRKYVELYTPDQRKVLSVRPGITDYASIEYFDENELLAKSQDPEMTYIEEIMPAKLSLNLYYISRQSFLTDLRIIFRTIFKLFS